MAQPAILECWIVRRKRRKKRYAEAAENTEFAEKKNAGALRVVARGEDGVSGKGWGVIWFFDSRTGGEGDGAPEEDPRARKKENALRWSVRAHPNKPRVGHPASLCVGRCNEKESRKK